MTDELETKLHIFARRFAHLISSHPLGSARESRRRVPHTENIAIGTVLDAVKNAVLLSLPVPTPAGLKLLHDQQNERKRGKS